MDSKYDRFSSWLDQRRGPRNAADEAALLAIVEAYDAAIRAGKLSDEQLKLVVNGASSSRALLWNNASDLLKLLSGRWSTAAHAIAMMARNPCAQVRFVAMCSLGDETLPEVVDAVLAAGLTDKSSRVRWKAAERANELGRAVLVPNVAAALAIEPNSKVRDSIELSLRMLRDGYWIRPESPGDWSKIIVRTPGGVASRSVSDQELQAKGIGTIVDELRGNLP